MSRLLVFAGLGVLSLFMASTMIKGKPRYSELLEHEVNAMTGVPSF